MLVYGYLVPNRQVSTCASQISSSQIDCQWDEGGLRTDGSPCAPAMLRSNRQIYTELVKEWYGNATYEIRIQRYDRHHFNRPRHLWTQPELPYEVQPSALYCIRSLIISFDFDPVVKTDDSIPCEALTAFVDMLSSKQSSLQKLELDVWASDAFLSSVEKHPGGLKTALEAEFRLFRRIQRLSELKISIHIRPTLWWNFPKETRARWEEEGTEYAEALRTAILTPSQS